MAKIQFKSFKPRRYSNSNYYRSGIVSFRHIGPDHKSHFNKEICARCGWTMGEHYGTDPYSECPTPKKK